MSGSGRQDKTRQAGKSAKGAATSALRVVDNSAAQEAATILPVSPPDAGRALPRRAAIVDIPGGSEAEDIRPSPPATNVPRLQNGFRIVENRAYQRKQRIFGAPPTVPAGDEIAFKKLFTRFEEAFVTRDMAALADCLSPAFTWKLPNGQVVYGRKAALDEMERRFAMPNGPRFSGSVWRFRGETVLQSYDVEYLGPDGRWRQSRGFDLYEIGGGLITLKDAYWKMIP